MTFRTATPNPLQGLPTAGFAVCRPPLMSNVNAQMRHIALALSVVAAAQAAHADPLAGTYVSRQKNICFVGPPGPSGEMTWTDCSVTRDELKIVKKGAQYSVDLSMVFANGHTCEFAGTGKQQAHELVIADPEQPSCPLTLEFRGSTVRLTQLDECRYNYCGARGSINGATLFRRRAR